MNARRLARGVICVALSVAGLARLAGASAPEATGPVINLPPLLVEEKDRALEWRYLARPGFEVLSVCDDDVTEQFIDRQMRLAELLSVVLPDRFQVHLALPEAHVLFNEETGRARSREIVADMVRKAGGTLDADGVVQSEAPARLDFRSGRAPQISFLPNMRLSDVDAVRVFAILDDSGRARMDFIYSPEHVAFLLSRRTPALPDWFLAGMLEVYRRLGFTEDAIEFRPFVWRSDEESAALAREPDQPRTFLPMREVFTRRPVREGAPTTEAGQIWRAQAALFVRWALADPSGGRRAALWRWLDRLDSGPPTEEAFQACFGCGFADLRDRLSDYLPVAVRDSVFIKGPKPGARPPFNPHRATDLEVACIRGDWERLEISHVRARYPALMERYVDQARRTLHRAYDRGERDPRLLAVLGLTECDAGNPAAAQPLLAAAARGGVTRPRVYLELARAHFAELTASDPEHRFSPAEASQVLEPLRAAHRLAPPLADVYALAARVYLQGTATPNADDRAMLEAGARFFPTVPGIVIVAINLHLAAGEPQLAADLARAGWRHARDATERERFARIEAQLAATAK